MDFSGESKLKGMVYGGFMDGFCRMWRFDTTSNKLELLKENQSHLDGIKNVSMKGDLGYVVTTARVLINKIFLNKKIFPRTGLPECGKVTN